MLAALSLNGGAHGESVLILKIICGVHIL